MLSRTCVGVAAANDRIPRRSTASEGHLAGMPFGVS